MLPLKYIPDDSTKIGSKPGHGVITLVTDGGDIDLHGLKEWASKRDLQANDPRGRGKWERAGA